MSSNFTFLQTKFAPLAHLGEMAEQYCYSDPNSCLMKIGMMGETIVKAIFHYDRIALPLEDNAVNRINKLQEEDYISNDIADVLHVIRKARNKAVHDNLDSQPVCAQLLPMIWSVCQWFMEVYGDYNYQPSGRFEMPHERPKAELKKESRAQKVRDQAIADTAIENFGTVVTATEQERKQQAKKASHNRNITEEETRMIIDEQLNRVGWLADTVNLRYARGACPKKGVNQAIAEWPVQNGYADYALFAGLQLVGIIEAKRWDTDVVSIIDQQATDYPKLIREEDVNYVTGQWGEYKVPFTFATNGRRYIKQYEEKSGIWFRDLRDPANVPKALPGWFSPEGLLDKLKEQPDQARQKLDKLPYDELRDPNGLNLRDYQIEAIAAAENAIEQGKKSVLLAMATGTGKTRTVLGMIYRFLKTNRFHRILFLVDRNVLGSQALTTFQEVRLEQMLPLTSIYNVQGLDKDESLAKETRVQIATVQSMVRRILYHEGEAGYAISDFDLVIIDEAHRGYILDKDMTQEQSLYRDEMDYISKYRSVMEYFDAVKIALTATPALHTTQIFGSPVYTYSYRDAVIDGYLVDHNVPISLKTKLNTAGIHYKKGQEVDLFDPNEYEGVSSYEVPDDLNFDVDRFNREIIPEGFNKAVLREISNRIDPTDREAGKTLIYAVNDRHADMIVRILKEYYGEQGIPSEAVMKITGSIENGNQKKIQDVIRRFKNEQYPSIVVTVDLLTTGIDVPSITNLVFLRRVKSRILFEQMLGRATRLCPDIHKDKFDIYDAVGTYASFEPVNTMKPVVVQPKNTFHTMIEGLKDGSQTREAIQEKIDQVVAKLQRKQKNVQPDDEETFAVETHTVNIRDFIRQIRKGSPEEAKAKLIASEPALTELEKAKPPRAQIILDHQDDVVTEVSPTYGADETPQDYLAEFTKWINTNKNDIAALNLVLTSPKDLTYKELKQLRKLLGQHDFTETQLNTALKGVTKKDVAADIISLIRRAAMGSPLISRQERMQRAITKIKRDLQETGGLTKAQENFLTKVGNYFVKDENYTIHKEMFTDDLRFQREGGFKRYDKLFNNQLEAVLGKLNDYLYDDTEGGTSA